MSANAATSVLCDAREAVDCGREHADVIVGMKVRSGRIAGGTSGIAPVEVALEAADKLQLPLMTHIDFPPPGRSEVIGRLRPGDILTHCFKAFPNSPIDGAGLVREDARAARARGVIFDIGHGMGSFDFEVAERHAQGWLRAATWYRATSICSAPTARLSTSWSACRSCSPSAWPSRMRSAP